MAHPFGPFPKTQFTPAKSRLACVAKYSWLISLRSLCVLLSRQTQTALVPSLRVTEQNAVFFHADPVCIIPLFMPGFDVAGVFGGSVRGRAPSRRNDGSPRGTTARAGKAAGVRTTGGEVPQSPPPTTTTKTAASNKNDEEGKRSKPGQPSTPPSLHYMIYPLHTVCVPTQKKEVAS